MHKIIEEDILTGKETLVREISDEEVTKKMYIKSFDEPSKTVHHCHSCGTEFSQLRPTNRKERGAVIKRRRLQPDDEDFRIESRAYYWKARCPKCGAINIADFVVQELCYPWWITPPTWSF